VTGGGAEVGDHERRRDEQRDQRRRRQEQGRDEQQLGRHDDARPGHELDPGDHRKGDHEQAGQHRVEVARSGREHGERDGGQHERRRERDVRARSRRASPWWARSRVSTSSCSCCGEMSGGVVIRGPRAGQPPRPRLAWLVAAEAALLAMAGPAHAGLLAAEAAGCEQRASARVFVPWLDPANYVLATGGDAESVDGWALDGGARIVPGNEPWRVGSPDDGSSLLLPSGSSATTGAMCVGLEHPTLRFFARTAGDEMLSTLSVEVLFEGLGGALEALSIGVVAHDGGWRPTLPFPVVANLLPLLPGERTAVAFRFTPRGGSWQIDDVYVDPWKAR